MHPALPLQEEECQAHCGCDVAGGPTGYEQVEAACSRAGAMDGTIFRLTLSLFSCLATEMHPCSANISVKNKSSMVQNNSVRDN